MWLGAVAKADPDLIPDCHQHESSEWASIPRYAHFKANYLLVLDNLLDFSHLSYVHENSLGGSKPIAGIRPKVEQTRNGVKLTRWYLNEPEFAPYLHGYERFTGPIDRWNIYHLSTLSNHFSMSSGSAPAGTGAPDGKLAFILADNGLALGRRLIEDKIAAEAAEAAKAAETFQVMEPVE